MAYEEQLDNLNIKLIAKREKNNQEIRASAATKSDGPFYCPDTFEELIVRKCVEKRDHFAYKARLSRVASMESKLHENCKNELLDALMEAFPDGKWEKERENFKSDKLKGYTKVRPDLSGRIGEKGVIVEIQASTLSISTILNRIEQYSKRGAYILWIVPLEEDLGTENFRPRLFERYLHTMFYGRVYYWYNGNGSILIPVHYGTAYRSIIESHWFEKDGTERFEGGYFKSYLRVKKPVFGPNLDLLTDFKMMERDSFDVENEQLSVPKSKILMDNQLAWWPKEIDKSIRIIEN